MRKITALLFTALLVSTAASFSLSQALSTDQQSGDVALIDLSGTITPSSGGFSTGITPENVRKLNQEAETRGVDAIIYEINSGGGAVVASKEVRRSIEEVDVPTICRIRDVGASGAYLLSLGCDSIVADSASMTGSIGVSSSYLEFSELMEKAGINYVNITAGENKEVSSPYQEPTEEEKQILKEKAGIIGDEFLQDVSESRGLNNSQRREVRTAEVFLGSEAEKLGLVDELGGRETAVSKAENITGKNMTTVQITTQEDFSLLSMFFADLKAGNGSPLKAVL